MALDFGLCEFHSKSVKSRVMEELTEVWLHGKDPVEPYVRGQHHGILFHFIAEHPWWSYTAEANSGIGDLQWKREVHLWTHFAET